MQKVLICALTLAVTSTSVKADAQYSVYTVLKDHPACSGTGKIAYEARFDVAMEEAVFLREGDRLVPEGCTIRTRRGETIIETAVPCAPGVQRSLTLEDARRQVCTLTASLRPVEIALTGSLTGCITLNGHRFVDGDWTATVERPDGTEVLSGGHDDQRLEASYSSNSEGVFGVMNPFLEISLRLPDAAIDTLPGAVVEIVGIAYGVNRLHLVDGSKPGCANDPAPCLTPAPKVAVRAAQEEWWPYCSANSNGYGVTRDAPRDAEN